MVIAGGEVIDEARQRIIRFDRADRQGRSDFNIEPSPKHYIQRPIARGAERASGAILVNLLVEIGMRAANQPLEERLHALDANFYLCPEIPGEQVGLRGLD